jgi:hypothetical protein
MPSKIEYYITLGWKCLPGTNTLAYWAPLQVAKKLKFCEYDPLGPIHNASFFLKLYMYAQ